MIKLRELSISDKEQLRVLADNRKIWDNVRNYLPHPYKLSDAEFFINSVNKETPKQNFGIEYKGELCGVIGLILQDDVYKKSAELGYWSGEPFWGNGIATKAVELITKYGFEKLDIIRIYSSVFENNIASMKVLEKNEFLKEGIFKKAIIKNDIIMDEHLELSSFVGTNLTE